MADYVFPVVRYPGLGGLISAEYTCSHGTSPGTIVIRTQPGGPLPAAAGDVYIGDNRKGFPVKGCKLERFEQTRNDGGIEWVFSLSDRRWQWRNGYIEGFYNQLDPHAKLIPKTVRSPTELAALCLREMGVSRFVIDMPDGIPSAAVAAIPEFLPTGVNFPQIGINPPVNWYAENPAAALAQLAESCGRRFVYDPVTDTVLIVRPGFGNPLPSGHVANVSPSLTAAETPDGVVVVGDPTHYQPVFELYAVGLEWDKTLRPVDELSYAPRAAGSKCVVAVKVTAWVESSSYAFNVSGDGIDAGVRYNSPLSGNVNAAATGLAAACVANATLSAKVSASAAGDTVTLTGLQDGFNFSVSLIHTDRMSVTVVQAGAAGKRGWQFSPPPLFPGIVATDRLTKLQALALAQQSVFRMYRLTGRDVSGRTGITVPGYGPGVARQDVVLLNERVEQVVPSEGDRRFVDLNGEPLIRNVYDGFSRSMPPAVYGSVMRQLLDNGSSWFIGDGKINAAPAAPAGGKQGIVQVVFAANTNHFDYVLTVTPASTGVAVSFAVTGTGGTPAQLAAAFVAAIEASADPAIRGKFNVSSGDEFLTIASADVGYAFTAAGNTGTVTVNVVQAAVGPAPAVAAQGDGVNTAPTDQVYVDFSIDPTFQNICFTSYIYRSGPGTIEKPKLYLECGCQVRDVNTKQFASYKDFIRFRPGPAVQVERKEDVQLNVIGKYKYQGGTWVLTDTQLLEADAVLRARYYLQAAILQYQVKGGSTVEFNGIEPVSLDGAVMQVTWSIVGGSGITTTVSRNMEHSTWVRPYPLRRRAENLDAVARKKPGGRGGNSGDSGSIGSGGTGKPG